MHANLFRSGDTSYTSLKQQFPSIFEAFLFSLLLIYCRCAVFADISEKTTGYWKKTVWFVAGNLPGFTYICDPVCEATSSTQEDS